MQLPGDFDANELCSVHLGPGDEPVFLAKEGGLGKLYIGWGWKKFQIPKSFSHVSDYSIHEGKPLYKAWHGDEQLIMWGEQEFVIDDQEIGWPHILDGKPLYYVDAYTDKAHETRVMWGDELLTNKHHNYDLCFTSEQPVYSIECKDGFRVRWGKKESRAYERIWDLSVADDKPLFAGYRDNKWFIVWGFEELDAPYYGDESDETLSIDEGKPSYIGSEGDGRCFVVWGEERSSIWNDVRGFCIDNGLPLFVARQRDGRFYVVSGEHSFPAFDGASRPIKILDGKPLYLVFDRGDMRIVWDKLISRPYDGVESIKVTDDRIDARVRSGSRILDVTILR